MLALNFINVNDFINILSIIIIIFKKLLHKISIIFIIISVRLIFEVSNE